MSPPPVLPTSTAARRLSLAIAIVVACRPTPPDDLPPSCDEGWIDDGGTCVPEACGTGTWGALVRDDATLHVDAGHCDLGDGSEAAPFCTIGEALERAAELGGGRVVVAAGTYRETLRWSAGDGALALAGRCAAMVALDASEGDEQTPGISVDARGTQASVEGLRVLDAGELGILVQGGEVALSDLEILQSGSAGLSVNAIWATPPVVTMRDSLIEGAGVCAVLAYDEGTVVTLQDTILRATRQSSGGTHGIGINVHSGAELEAVRCEIERSAAIGVRVKDDFSTVWLRSTTIRDTQAEDLGVDGWGALVYEGGQLVLVDSSIEDTRGEGLSVWGEGAYVHLDRSDVLRTTPSSSGQLGAGVVVTDRARLECDAATVSEATWVGVLASGDETVARLDTTTVRDVLPSEERGSEGMGLGLAVDGGASLACTGCTIEANRYAGALVTGEGSALSFTDSRVERTATGADGLAGVGIHAQDGATLTLSESVVEQNHDVGISINGLRHTAGEGRTTAVVEDSEIRDTFQVQQLGSAVGGYGINLTQGARLELRRSLVEGNRTVGIQAGQEGTELVVEDATVSGTRRGLGEEGAIAVGLAVQRGASLLAEGLISIDNQGPGLLVNAASEGRCEGCRFSGNEFAGAALLDGAALDLVACELTDNGESVNLSGGVGVYADVRDEGTPTLLLEGCTIGGSPIAGVWLGGPGSYRLLDSTIGGGSGEPYGAGSRCGDAVWAGFGVEAWDGSSGLAIAGSSLGEAVGASVFLHDASAALAGNHYGVSAVDLIVQGEHCAEPHESWSEVGSSDVCPTWDYGICEPDLRTLLKIEGVDP